MFISLRILTLDRLPTVPQHAHFLPVFILKGSPTPALTIQSRMTPTMPTHGAYARDEYGTSLIWDNGQAAPTLTVTINQGYGGIPRKKDGVSGLMRPGVIGAIVAVSVLVVICMVTAATLHRLWCMKPDCKACLIFRCGRRKPQKGMQKRPSRSTL